MTAATLFRDQVTVVEPEWLNAVDINAFGVCHPAFGADPTGVEDSTAAVVAYMAAYPGTRVYFPKGVYKLTNLPAITRDGTYFVGDGPGETYLQNAGTNADCLQFQPTAPTSGSFLNNVGCSGMTIYRATAATAGAGVRYTQCNTYFHHNVVILDHPEGLSICGGQAGKLGPRIHVETSNLLVGSPLANSYCLRFYPAPLSGGSYQQVYTTQVQQATLGGNQVIDVGISIEGCDGVSMDNVYNANAFTDLIRLKRGADGVNVSNVSGSNMYNDGVFNTLNALRIEDDGFATGSITQIVFDSTCSFANVTDKGLYADNPGLLKLEVDPFGFYNIGGTKFDVTGGPTAGIRNIPVPVTLTPTYASAGAFSYTPGVMFAQIVRTNDTITLNFDINVSAISLGGATGNLWLSGLPVAASSAANYTSYGTMAWGGITKASYTNVVPRISAGGTVIEFVASGSGVGLLTVTASDTPASFLQLRGTLIYQADP